MAEWGSVAVTDYGVVVIGSGLGALTAAALLAKAGRKVCVLERNASLGGAASCYKVGQLTIEASLHETADPHDPRDLKHHILKSLGILDDITWLPIEDLYTIKGGPFETPFVMPHGFEAACACLGQRFPAETAGVGRILGRMEAIYDTLGNLNEARESRSVRRLLCGLTRLRPIVSDWRASLADVLHRDLGTDTGAGLALGASLPYYSDDPGRLWWLLFAVAQGGYIGSGGVYIRGGSRMLSLALAKAVKLAGGSVLLGRRVTSIETDVHGKVMAVRHGGRAGGEEARIETRQVLAGCAPSSLEPMLADDAARRLGAAFAGRAPSMSLFTAHFGLKEPPARFGLSEYATVLLPPWMKCLGDYARAATLLGEPPRSEMPPLMVCNYGAVDARLGEPGTPTLVTVAGVDRIGNWRALAPEDERARRAAWLEAILDLMERHYPGFAAAVTDKIFVSARSMSSYLGTPDGAVYGFDPRPPARPFLAGAPRSPATPIPGLLLASSYAGSGGFTGAMGAGADAARMALKTASGGSIAAKF
jgi:all-trans-retinol 13,14-reductase